MFAQISAIYSVIVCAVDNESRGRGGGTSIGWVVIRVCRQLHYRPYTYLRGVVPVLIAISIIIKLIVLFQMIWAVLIIRIPMIVI